MEDSNCHFQAAQRKSVSETRNHIRSLIMKLGLVNAAAEDPLSMTLQALTALERTVAEDFRSRGQSITDLVSMLYEEAKAYSLMKLSRSTTSSMSGTLRLPKEAPMPHSKKAETWAALVG